MTIIYISLIADNEYIKNGAYDALIALKPNATIKYNKLLSVKVRVIKYLDTWQDSQKNFYQFVSFYKKKINKTLIILLYYMPNCNVLPCLSSKLSYQEI